MVGISVRKSGLFITASTVAFVLASANPAAAQAATVADAQGSVQDVDQSAPAGAIATSGIAAQTVDPQADTAGDIVVTGSRIARRNLDSGQPTLVLDSQLIEQRGYSNVAEALQDLPSFGVPGSSRVGAQAGAFGSGQSFLNWVINAH